MTLEGSSSPLQTWLELSSPAGPLVWTLPQVYYTTLLRKRKLATPIWHVILLCSRAHFICNASLQQYWKGLRKERRAFRQAQEALISSAKSVLIENIFSHVTWKLEICQNSQYPALKHGNIVCSINRCFYLLNPKTELAFRLGLYSSFLGTYRCFQCNEDKSVLSFMAFLHKTFPMLTL